MALSEGFELAGDLVTTDIPGIGYNAVQLGVAGAVILGGIYLIRKGVQGAFGTNK